MPLKLSRRDASMSARACRAFLHVLEADVARGNPQASVQAALVAEVESVKRLIALYETHAKAVNVVRLEKKGRPE